MSPASDFRRALMRWYRSHGRHGLPWRLSRDPYAVLVSEIMLQQTQVGRVLPYYERWLIRWPTVDALAAATPADVIREWGGLGYNRRALYLQRAAVAIVERHGGVFPTDVVSLRALPGVGPYTAAAVAAFAYEVRVPVTDTNIARVLARSVLGVASHRELPAGTFAAAARAMLPARRARDHNLALMDLGASVCGPRVPRCEECPIRRHCAWRAAGSPPAVARRRPAARFESTDRYARGRIIAALREHTAMNAKSLTTMLPPEHRARVDLLLLGLERDGLVCKAGRAWSLPVERTAIR